MTAIQKIINNPNKPQISAADAAEYLGVSNKTLAMWRSTKRYVIPYYKIGSIVRYAQADLDAFLQSTRISE